MTKLMLKFDTTKKIEDYVKSKYPQEAGGFIHGGDFLPLENISLTPDKEYAVNPNDIPLEFDAIIHSHTNGLLVPSKEDMLSQIRLDTTAGLLTCTNTRASLILWWGKGIDIPPLIGREFRAGPTGSDGRGDCYALIRDWYRLNRQVDLMEFPRDEHWWEFGDNLYRGGYEDAGFVRIKQEDIQIGDVFLAQIRSKVPNHGGIYVGNGLVLHHLERRLSRRDPIGPYSRYVTHWLRYVG